MARDGSYDTATARKLSDFVILGGAMSLKFLNSPLQDAEPPHSGNACNLRLTVALDHRGAGFQSVKYKSRIHVPILPPCRSSESQR